MNKKNKKLLEPKWRFPEFRGKGEWSKQEFKNLVEIIEKRTETKKYTLMSVTAGEGLVSQIEKFGREIAGNAYKNYYVIQKGDFAYNKSATKQYPEGYIAMLTKHDQAALPNSIFVCFRVTDKNTCPKILDHLFHANYHGSWLRKFIAVGARAHGSLNVDTKHLLDMSVVLPSFPEQQRIADCLTSLDELITTQTKKVDTLKTHKKGLMQKLFPSEGKTVPEWRFPEFRGKGEWEVELFKNLVDTIAPPEKLQTSQYQIDGLYPIIDQSQCYICGWTDNNDYLITNNLPLIIFGDHTCVLKLVSVPFAQGADGIKILKPKIEKINTVFIYQSLNNNPVIMEEYKRHFSILKERVVCFPTSKKEQQRIADCLTSLDELITTQTKKVDTLKTHKKGLMQGLFPSADEVGV